MGEYFWQTIYLILTIVSLIWTATRHGKPRDNHDIWYTLFGTAVILAILFLGGFFPLGMFGG